MQNIPQGIRIYAVSFPAEHMSKSMFQKNGCFLRLSRKWLIINATTHTFLERSFRALSKNVWVVALIVNRFRDKRKNHPDFNYFVFPFIYHFGWCILGK